MAGDPCPRSPQALLAAGSFVSMYHPRLWDLVPTTAPGWAGTQLDSWALGGVHLAEAAQSRLSSPHPTAIREPGVPAHCACSGPGGGQMAPGACVSPV